jgi:predicted AlkP superfamily pyrophosphatase or phosphodiesterase
VTDHVILLSVPGLRAQDLPHMPQLRRLVADGDHAPLVPSFPAVTWPVQANMLTGTLPREHGVVANGFYWRDQQRVEMWTATNDKIQRPQIWDRLHRHQPQLTSAVWFPMLSKQCGADYICMPAPVHHPDGSESLWCYTRPTELYGQFRDELGHFPLQHFWGPLANIQSTAWIADSAARAAREFHPCFFYVYLPHLDYAAQKTGPNSHAAIQACRELDEVIGRLAASITATFSQAQLLWLVASEYTIVPVRHVTYPNRLLRQAGLLAVRPETESSPAEQLDFAHSRAWALVDHQFSHIYLSDPADIGAVVDVFKRQPGVSQVLAGTERERYGMDHERSGEVIVISDANSWQAYYWWLDDARAPSYARQVDIHRKPGYDPVELHFDESTRSIPLNASLVGGSHGAPAVNDEQRGVLLSSQKGVVLETATADTDVCDIVLRQFGI